MPKPTKPTTIPQGFYAPPPPPPPPAVGSGLYQQNIVYSYSSGVSGSLPSSSPRKRPRPEEAVKCTACNLDFDTQVALDAHLASHIKCNACDFQAAPKAVRAHFAAKHGRFSGSGFKTVEVEIPGCKVQRFRICVGNRPEDIQKWIAERRRRFPRSGQTKPAPDEPRQPAKEAGLSTLLDGYSSSDDDWKPEASTAAQPPPASTLPTPSDERKRPCRFFARNGKCRNGDQCSFSHDIANTPKQPDRRERRAPETLLQKLLQKDVRRENLLALQLLEYIADTDFLKKRKPLEESE